MDDLSEFKEIICTCQGVEFECLIEAPRRNLRDYIVTARAVATSGIEYRFEIVMVRTPPRYSCNSIRVYPVAVAGAPQQGRRTRFIWLNRSQDPGEAKDVFARCLAAVATDYNRRHPQPDFQAGLSALAQASSQRRAR